jgi:hypothetical protein
VVNQVLQALRAVLDQLVHLVYHNHLAQVELVEQVVQQVQMAHQVLVVYLKQVVRPVLAEVQVLRVVQVHPV